MFDNFPKEVRELPQQFQDIYKEHYQANREGKTFFSMLSQHVESWMHRRVAADVQKKHGQETLEIGAGTLNQLRYEESHSYDIIEPFSELYAHSPSLASLRNIYAIIDDVPMVKRYDRIISVATFEHIHNLPQVVAKSCLLLKEGGCLRTGIPHEGNWLWTLGWKLTTGIEFKRRYGLDYGVLMRYEHVNTAREICTILDYFYGKNEYSWYGLGPWASLYVFIKSEAPHIERAKAFLQV